MVPRFSYCAEVWYSYLHKPKSASKAKGLVVITNKLRSVQQKVAKSFTGGLSTMAGKIQFRATFHLCSLPEDHLLHSCILSVAHCKVKRHLSPLHHLINFAGLNPNKIETISPVRRSPWYNPTLKTIVLPSREAAFPNLTNSTIPFCVYSDGSGYERGIRAATLLYINDWLSRSL